MPWLVAHPRGTSILDEVKLDPQTTFRRIIVGSTNRRAITLARRAVGAAADRPNPLLLVGRSGVGKSAVLHAAANEAMKRRPAVRLGMFTAEELATAYVTAIRAGHVSKLRQSIDAYGVFVVDGLEDLRDKPSTLAELEGMIRRLVARNVPVLLATLAPHDEALMMVRDFPCGVIATLAEPTIEQKVAVLRRLAASRRCHAPRAQLRSIARTSRTIPHARSNLETTLFVERQRRVIPHAFRSHRW